MPISSATSSIEYARRSDDVEDGKGAASCDGAAPEATCLAAPIAERPATWLAICLGRPDRSLPAARLGVYCPSVRRHDASASGRTRHAGGPWDHSPKMLPITPAP